MLERPISKERWTRVAFGDVVRLSKARVADPEAAGIERVVGLEHIEPDDLRIRRWGDVTDGTTFTTLFKPGQVLFGKRRAYQRKVAVADFEGVCSGDIYVLEPANDQLMPELLPFLCQTDAFFDHAVGTSAGSLSPRTNWTSLAGFEFLLPPIQEQARIVEAVYAVSDYEESLDLAIKALDAAEESMLENFLFIGNLPRGEKKETLFSRLQPEFELAKISDVADVAYGISAAVSDNVSPDIGWPILTGANILLEGSLSLDKLVYYPAPRNPNFMLEKGDVLLNWRSGSAEHVGKAAIFDQDGSWTFASFILRVRPYGNLNNLFLWRVLNFMRKRKLFGAATSQQINFKMNAAYFRDVLIPAPPKGVQDQMVEKLREPLINRATPSVFWWSGRPRSDSCHC
jgi:type I restriction enzyme S subunit